MNIEEWRMNIEEWRLNIEEWRLNIEELKTEYWRLDNEGLKTMISNSLLKYWFSKTSQNIKLDLEYEIEPTNFEIWNLFFLISYK